MGISSALAAPVGTGVVPSPTPKMAGLGDSRSARSPEVRINSSEFEPNCFSVGVGTDPPGRSQVRDDAQTATMRIAGRGIGHRRQSAARIPNLDPPSRAQMNPYLERACSGIEHRVGRQLGDEQQGSLSQFLWHEARYE